jgi:hypothetical protein
MSVGQVSIIEEVTFKYLLRITRGGGKVSQYQRANIFA